MSQKKLVWDFPVRAFHWLLVVSLITLYVTSELGTDYMQYHIYAGYFTIGLVAFRVIWGFVGTKHAQFLNFIPSPRKLLDYLRGEKKHAVGHNPLGSLMVLLMLALVGLQAISGLFVSDDILYSGPYNGTYSEELDKLMTTIHHTLFDFILVAIAIHVVAIVFYQKVKKQDIIRPMISGKKTEHEIPQGEDVPHSKWITAAIVICLVALFVYWLVVLNVPVIEEEFYF